jgi:AFG3 family protein
VPIPQCIYAQQRARRFATGPPEEPKNKKDDEILKKEGQADKSEPEDAKKDSKDASPQMAKLTEEEEKMLDQLVSFVSMGVPNQRDDGGD